MKEAYEVDTDYIGMIDWRYDESPTPLMVVVAILKPATYLNPGDRRLRLLTATELKASINDMQLHNRFERAAQWVRARTIACNLKEQIDQAIRKSIAYLDNHSSVEDGRLGWNQYLDSGPLGILSTAEGLLAHSHAGILGEFLERPADAIEALQNPDGGWRVRSSLVGALSSLSVTESTCACLWALQSTGRSLSNPSVVRGIDWLEGSQRPDGGWSSSEKQDESFVFPTTAAARVLARYGRREALAKAIAWLRKTQRADGGWGATSPEGSGEQSSSPAYTAYVIVTLITAGLTENDDVVAKGCDYLLATFSLEGEEPWEPTSFNTSIDQGTSARLDFRHFATPWALAALCLAGFGLDHPTVIAGLNGLLKLQDQSGGWRCRLNAPRVYAVWAVHDALFALRTVLSVSVRDLQPVALSTQLSQERAIFQAALPAAIAKHSPSKSGLNRTKGWISTVWMSLLTVGLALLALYQFGVLSSVANSSGVQKFLAAAASVVVAVVSALAPAILAEEYKVRRAAREEKGVSER